MWFCQSDALYGKNAEKHSSERLPLQCPSLLWCKGDPGPACLIVRNSSELRTVGGLVLLRKQPLKTLFRKTRAVCSHTRVFLQVLTRPAPASFWLHSRQCSPRSPECNAPWGCFRNPCAPGSWHQCLWVPFPLSQLPTPLVYLWRNRFNPLLKVNFENVWYIHS